MHNQVVDAHGHKVNANSVVNAAFNGDFQLGADTIIGGDQNRINKFTCGQVEQAAKAAEVAIGTGAGG